MRRNKVLFFLGFSLLIIAYSLAQISSTSPVSPAHFLPSNALAYVETPNLKSLLAWWRDSDFRKEWQKTKNYEAFTNSRLFLKLQDRISEWGSQGSFAFSPDNLITLAGGKTGLALYDIGDLKAVALSEISLAEAQGTELWAAKAKFTRKKSGQQNYYVEPADGSLAFAYTRPFLVVASDEALLLQTIQQLQGTNPSPPLDGSETWQNLQKLNPPHSTFSIYLNQEALNSNHYFNRYWIHQNTGDLKPIQAAWIDFALQDKKLSEHRYFIRNDQVSGESVNTDSYLQPFRGLHFDFLTLQDSPSAAAVAGHVVRLVNSFPEQFRKSSYPPNYSAALERAGQAGAVNSFEQKIDEPVLVPASERLLKADQQDTVTKLLDAAQPKAELRVAYPLWDDQALFVQFPQSIVIQAANFDALDQQQLLNQIAVHYQMLASVRSSGNLWQDLGNGSYSLQGLRPIFVHFQKPWIVFSNRQQEFQQVCGVLPAQPAALHGSYVEINWDNSRWKYSRLMHRLDHGNQDTPMFFSENVDSLLWALSPIQRSVIERDSSQETVNYELK